MRHLVVLLALLSIPAFGADKLIANLKEGVTLDQVKAASEPISVASFKDGERTYGLKCSGASGALLCEIWDPETKQKVVGADKSKICKSNEVVLATKSGGFQGKFIVLPEAIVLPGEYAECGSGS